MMEETISHASASTAVKKATTVPTAQSLKYAGSVGKRYENNLCLRLLQWPSCLLSSGSCEGWLSRTRQVLQLPPRRSHLRWLPWAGEVQEVQETGKMIGSACCTNLLPINLVPHVCSCQGHVKDDCPEPDRCYNCREEGHTTADCPEPEKCRRCRKEGHKVDECPEPMKCGK